MSAIAGLFWPSGQPVDPLDLSRMVDILTHRGPDGADVWCGESVGLGHRMLWTTPESLQEKLPLANPTGSIVITAEARIDNRDELISALDLTHRPPAEITDSQLILDAYERWGERCPEYLLGDFAFAIWDGHRQAMFCTRDHFGMKPFYYCYRPGLGFAFASEIKALFALPWVPRRLNEVRVADYLDSLVEDQAITFYEEIFRLPPAHSMTVDCAGLRLQEYWSLDPAREVQYSSDEEYAEAFREIFAEAVRCRLRSAFPVGASLSGGLDSSSVVGVARSLAGENGHHPLHTFSCIFEDLPECDEREFIHAVLAQGSLQPHYVHPDRLSALGDIDRILWHQDQPIFIRNMFLWTAMFGAAQAEGVRIMLDGEDGDTVVSHGEGYLAELATTGRWAEFAQGVSELSRHFESYCTVPTFWLRRYGFAHLNRLARAGKWIAFSRATNEMHRWFGISRRLLFWKQGLRPVTPKLVRWVWRALHGYPNVTRKDNSLVDLGFAQRIGFAERTKALTARYTLVWTQREEHWLGLSGGFTSCVHEELNKTAAAFGIETRHPFWDRRVVEFCLAVPGEQKLRQGWPRWILRRAMTGFLPDAVQWRVGKSNLGANFQRSLLDFERDRLEELVGNDLDRIVEYVDVPTLREAYRRRDANAVWPAVILALWLHQTSLTSGACQSDGPIQIELPSDHWKAGSTIDACECRVSGARPIRSFKSNKRKE